MMRKNRFDTNLIGFVIPAHIVGTRRRLTALPLGYTWVLGTHSESVWQFAPPARPPVEARRSVARDSPGMRGNIMVMGYDLVSRDQFLRAFSNSSRLKGAQVWYESKGSC